MDQDQVASQLSEILHEIQDNKNLTKNEFEKLQVALTGVLRLLTGGKESPLARIKENPQDLKGYIIRLVSDLYQDAINRWDTISMKVELVLQAVRNP
jgi:hypothetical protein